MRTERQNAGNFQWAEPASAVVLENDTAANEAIRRLDDAVDEAAKASFPASDPPGRTLGVGSHDTHGARSSDSMVRCAQDQPSIYVTTHDYKRLSILVDTFSLRGCDALLDFLADELERAELIPAAAVEPSVVTMNSQVCIVDPDTGDSRIVTLVYPGREDSLRGKVPIFTPLGTALLGLPEGALMTWRTLDGRTKSVAVDEIRYQPEAHGHDLDSAAVALP